VGHIRRVCGPPTLTRRGKTWSPAAASVCPAGRLHAWLPSALRFPGTELGHPAPPCGFTTASAFAGEAPHFLSNFQFLCQKSKKGLFPGCLPDQSRGRFQFKKSIFSAGNSFFFFFFFFSPFSKKNGVWSKFSRGKGMLAASSKALLIFHAHKMETPLSGGIPGILFLQKKPNFNLRIPPATVCIFCVPIWKANNTARSRGPPGSASPYPYLFCSAV